MRFLLFIAFSSLIAANLPMTIEVPETEVEISVHDLVGNLKKQPALPKGYAESVARVLEEAREQLNECIKLDEAEKTTVQVVLKISALGKGSASTESKDKKTKGVDCILSEISKKTFPIHPFNKDLTVKFPMTLERTQL